MSLTAGFTGTRDFATADSIFLWNHDANPGIPGYDDYYFLDARTFDPLMLRWVKTGDTKLISRDAAILLESDRSAIVRVTTPINHYSMPCPWAT